MLGGVFRPLGPLYCIQTNFPEEKNLVLLRWKGISRCCAQKSSLWEQRQKGKQVERGNLKPTGVFSQFSLDSLYNFNGGDCFPMLIRYLLQFLPVRFLTLLTLCFICAVSSPPPPPSFPNTTLLSLPCLVFWQNLPIMLYILCTRYSSSMDERMIAV